VTTMQGRKHMPDTETGDIDIDVQSEEVTLREEEPSLVDRRVSLFIGPQILATMLNLPEGSRVLGVYGDAQYLGLRVVVCHPDLPVAPERTELAPVVRGTPVLLREHFMTPDGKIYQRTAATWDDLADSIGPF
jgi:hypothetical protein